MENTVKVVLDPKVMQSISLKLKKIRLDYYLFFELVYRTGHQGLPLLRKSVEEIRQFCEDNKEYLPESLLANIDSHAIGRKDSDNFFSATRNPSQPLSKRTIENAFANAIKEYDLDGVCIRSIGRTFLYEQLRSCNYDFGQFTQFLRKRKRYFKDLETFIGYCGLTMDEYKEDVIKYISPASTLSKDCDAVIKLVKDIKNNAKNSELSAEDYRKYTEFINTTLVLAESLK